MVRNDHAAAGVGETERCEPLSDSVPSSVFLPDPDGGAGMYVVVQHQIKEPEVAFPRGAKLIKNEGAPAGVRGLQFYPSRDGSAVTCLWEAPSVDAVQTYVDSTLGDSSENTCYEVDAEQAFARQPLGLREAAAA
jgi:hypothetical protein